MKKRIPALIAAVVTSFFFGLLYFHIDLKDSFVLTSFESRWVDAKFRFRGKRPGGNEVVIVGMDDRTLEKLGSARVFERNNFARLVRKLGEAGPKAIGFDMNFPEDDRTSRDNDPEFAKAVAETNSVVLGVYLYLEKTTGPKRSADQEQLDPEMVQLMLEKQVFAAESIPPGGQTPSDFFRANKRLGNLPILTKAAASFGFVNFHPDIDGRLRYQPQLIEYAGRLYPSLDIQLLRQYAGAQSPMVHYATTGNIESVQVGSYSIPTDQFGRLLLDYTGPRGTYQTISMLDVLDGHVSPEVFRNKIVLIGAPSLGLNDIVPTPFDPTLPGVELHANVIDNILHDRFLYRGMVEGMIDLGIILIFGVVLGHFLPKFNASRSVFLSVVFLFALALFNYWVFTRLHLFLAFFYPGCSLAVTSFSLISYKYFTEEKERKRTKQTFKSYMDPHVVEQVLNQSELKLGGDKRELSVLFSDIRGFTSFSEKMAPTEVVHFLNQYFEKMQGLIFKNKGTLDKLIGDAVMCFWGAPLEAKDHALRGVVTALEMIQAVEDLRGVLVLPGGAKFDIGVGVNSGPMVIGNMGSPDRFSYTVMGDNVNLGSRLESLNKYYGTRIIISEATYEEVRDMVFCRELDTIQVKGKSHVVTIYEPMGLRRLEFERRSQSDRRGPVTTQKRIVRALVMLWHGERRYHDRRLGSESLLVSAEQEEIKTMYEHALALYRKGDFDGAEIGFDHVVSLNPSDGPSRLMKDRIAKYRKEFAGDEAHFDPVYRFDEK